MGNKSNVKVWLAVCWLVLALAEAAPAKTTRYLYPGDSIQLTINVSIDGDEIQVAPGEYKEAIDFKGKAVWLCSTGGPDVTTINATELGSSGVTCDSGEDANTKLEGFTITGGNAFKGGGMYNSGGSSPTVSNCRFAQNVGEYGGGMYNGYGSNPTVSNCTFEGNTAAYWGAGMFNKQSNPTVNNCTFSSNDANWDGGGMFNDLSNPTVNNCSFASNQANYSGGGMYSGNDSSPVVNNCSFSRNRADASHSYGTTENMGGAGMYNQDSSPTVTNCIFSGNDVGGTCNGDGGGGMYNYNSSPKITNCTFEENNAGLEGATYIYGGAMYNHESSPTVTNCTFSDNRADGTDPGDAMWNSGSSPTLVNCILWDGPWRPGYPSEIAGPGTPTVTYCDVRGGWLGTGNINEEPLFETGTLRLSARSPCIDAGKNDAVPSGVTTDLDGDPRFVDDPGTPDTGSGTPPIVDMGAYEFQPPPSPALVAHWSFDNPLDVGSDDSGNGNDGTATGAGFDPAGRIGGALQFDGQDDYVDCGNSASLDITYEITVAAWVMTNDASNSEHNPYVTKGDHSFGLKHFYRNSIDFFIYDEAWRSARFAVDGSFNGGWHHLAGTYDGFDVKLYVDGELQATTEHEGVIASSKFNVYLASNSEETDRYYDGLLDDVYIYNYALSQSEIQALMPGASLVEVPNVVGETQAQADADIHAADLTVGTITEVHSNTVPAGYVISQDPGAGALVPEGTSVDLTVSLGPMAPPTVGLVAHWTLDESSGGTAKDSAGGNDGILYGGAIWRPTGGLIDGALEFDGLDDYVDCGNSASLNIEYEITAAAWVNTNDAGNSQHNPYVAKGDHSYALKHHFDNSIEFFIYDGDWQGVHFDVDDSFNGGWHHLAGTYDGFELRLYLDGEPQATTEHEGVIASSGFPVYLASNSEETDRYYDGLLDDVRIYDVALTQSQIQALAAGPTVTLPVVTTLAATDVGQTSAHLRASVEDDGGEACHVRFRYKEGVAGSYVYTSWVSALTGQVVSWLVSDLSPGLTYYFNARARNSAGEADWADEEGLTTAAEAPSGLVAHWKLDEVQGTIAYDSAGDNDGTTYGGPVWLPDSGMIDGALTFDGLDDYVSLPIGSLIASLTDCTFATWVDFSNLGGPWQRIFDFGSNTTAYMFLTPRRGTAGEMRFGITVAGGGSPEQLAIAPSTLPSGWHHVAVTIEADINTVNLYLDGVVVATNIAVTLTPSDLGNTTNNWLGRSQYSVDAYFNGVLDDFRIYEYALSQSEIQALLPGPALVEVPDVVGQTQADAQSIITGTGLALGIIGGLYSDTMPAGYVISQNPTAGTEVPEGTSVDLTISLGPEGAGQPQACCFADGSCQDLTAEECLAQGGTPQGEGRTCATTTCPVPGLVAHWKLDESSGDIAEDSAGDNDGVTYGGPVWLPTDGMIGGALAFDGLDDYVDCGNSASLDITDEITVAAWVKTNDAANSEHNPYAAKGDHSYGLKHFYLNSIEFFIYDQGWRAVRYAVDHSFNGVWHHLAGTYDGSDLKLYVDGVLEATTAYVGYIASSSHNVNIASNSEMTDRYYDGLLDDVRIYDYALSQSEIQTLIPGPPLFEVPDVVGQTQADAQSIIMGTGLALGIIGGVYSDTMPAGYVISQNPTAGTDVPEATSVDLTISLGPEGVGQPQACCFADGSCQDLTAEECLAQGGTLQGEGRTCATTACPAPGPVAHWKLDETEGTIAYDSAGDNDGTTYGGPVWLPDSGMIDGALAFDGLDDYVSLPIGSLIASLTDCTFATWVDFSNLDGPWQRIFDFGSNRTAYMFLTPRLYTAGEMRFGITIEGAGSPEQLVTAPTTLPSGWHHVAVTIDADINTVNLYLDGVVVASNIAVTLTPSDLGNTANNWLGRSQYSADAYFNGALDDFRIYDYALSDEQIVRLLCIDPPLGDVTGDCRFDFTDVAILFSNWLTCTMTDCEESANPGLVAHYKLDEGSGTIATDASGNGHDGIAQNGEPNWVDGQTGYGKAMQWDGLTPGVGWVYCGTWDPSAVTGELTVATWAKWDGSNGAYQGLIGKRDGWDDQGTNMMWHIEINKNNSAVVFARAGVYPPCGDVVLPVGEWSHVAVTFDGATMIFYFNGAETGRGDFSFGSKADAAIVFGCVEASGWHGFNGALDDIRLYDYALSANEIDEIVQVSCTEPPAGDANNDCRFDFADLGIILSDWLTCTLPAQDLCPQ